MTDDEPTIPSPEDFVGRWGGRFRHLELLQHLARGGPAADLAGCILAGISSGEDEDGVLQSLVEAGEFRLAETVLAEASEVSDRVRARLADLEGRRAERVAQLTGKVGELRSRAAAAGVPFDVDEHELEARVRESWPAVEAILEEQGVDLAGRIDDLRSGLDERNRVGTDGPLRVVVERLISAGRLALAERVLGEGRSDLDVPEIHPVPPAWHWTDTPETVLSWHVDPTRARPAEFSAWQAADDQCRQLVEALDGLGVGGPEAARAFASALEVFIGGHGQPTVHTIDGGNLTSIALFRDEPLRRFHAAAGAELLIVPPGVRTPPDLPGVDHFLAVGPDLASGRGFRRGAAVITMADVLRLVTMPAGRAVLLARIAGAQWPLSALGAGGLAELADLLGDDPDHRWHTLCWLADLGGLGGSVTADALQFQCGDDIPTLHVLLEGLTVAQFQQGTPFGRPLDAWADLKHMSVGVEAAVLRNCPEPACRAAFWATLAAAPPGLPLHLDEVVLSASFGSAGEEADWEAVLPVGYTRLREQWFVEDAEVDTVRLKPLGVLTGLRRFAEHRLADVALELSALAGSSMPTDSVADEWAAHRHALSPDRPQRVPPFVDGEMTAAADQAVPTDDLIRAASSMTGTSTLADVGATLAAVAASCFPDAVVEVTVPATTEVAVPEPVVRTLLFELLDNALEATDWVGRVSLSARVVAGDVLIDVRDDGPGLAESIVRATQVFRRSSSTRGEGRGGGLHRARLIAQNAGGDLELTARGDGHPVFKGAHFTLVLPRHS